MRAAEARGLTSRLDAAVLAVVDTAPPLPESAASVLIATALRPRELAR